MASDLANLRVVLVDDEPFELKLLMHHLEKFGVTQVEQFTSGAMALQRLNGAGMPVDLVLLDLNMPGMDGVEFMSHLTQHGYAGGLVLISGEDARLLESAARLARAGRLAMVEHLAKPVQPQRLREVIQTWVNRAPERLRGARKSYTADELRRAIARHELVTFYQPKVAVSTGQMVGAEALVRWQHPQDGLVHPDRFVSLAEEHGLIDDLLAEVLQNALGALRRWRAEGLAWRMAINVSMENLTRMEFPDRLLAQIEKAGVTPSDLVLEVTESRLMEDPVAPLHILTRLRLKRIGLSIDDFGTGYSSLAQLRDIPFDEIKIDRGFVNGAHERETLRAIFDASQRMARQLGMKTVAEGVETRQDWDFLQTSGCDVAQGYFIARPMPDSALRDWHAAWQARRESVMHRAADGRQLH